MKTILLPLLGLAACTPTPPATEPTQVSTVRRPLPTREPTPTKPSTPASLVVATDPSQLDVDGIRSFPLLTTRDLIVRASVPGLDGGVTFVTLSMLSPDGTTPYTTRVAFSTDPAITQIEVAGAPHPYDVEHPTGTTMLQLDMHVPIAGTDLVRKSRPGPWNIEALVESKQPFTLSVPVDATM